MRFLLPPTWPRSLFAETQRLDEVVPSFFGPAPLPALNVWTEDETVHIQAELPGLTQEDVELTVLAD